MISTIVWDKAKKVADAKGKGTDWAFIADVYHYLHEWNYQVYTHEETGDYLIIGIVNDSTVLTIDKNNNPIIKELSDVLTEKKIFSTESDLEEIRITLPVGIFTEGILFSKGQTYIDIKVPKDKK